MATLFLCGDVMTGRAIDQILPHPGNPRLHEPYMRSAAQYVQLATQAHGDLPASRGFGYIWGDALAELDRVRPDARIANLETAVTTSGQPWSGKDIHYRMHPENVPCLVAAGLDACVLANNHVLDWGRAGLLETLRSLHEAGIRTAGAGRDAEQAAAPAVLDLRGGGRVLVFGSGMPGSGIPPEWAAGVATPGIDFLDSLSARAVAAMARRIETHRRGGDIVVVSIHWGPNWGYEITAEERRFARALVDEARVDVVHGHSSHHPKGIELHHRRPILYGCGDLVNDYEGIGGWEAFRPEISLLYFVRLDEEGALLDMRLVPMTMRRFRLERATAEERHWIEAALRREGCRLATRIEAGADGALIVSQA